MLHKNLRIRLGLFEPLIQCAGLEDQERFEGLRIRLLSNKRGALATKGRGELVPGFLDEVVVLRGAFNLNIATRNEQIGSEGAASQFAALEAVAEHLLKRTVSQ